MWMQQVNKDDPERVWLNITNRDGQTISAHFPVFKFLSGRNTASVSTNEGASRGATSGGFVADAAGSLIGLAYEDIANNARGVVQVYGYHESVLVMRRDTSVTVVPGHSLGPGNMAVAASVGFASTGNVNHPYGPVVALDTVTATMHSLGTIGANYANHVFIRCL
jgi:hypothetical protein